LAVYKTTNYVAAFVSSLDDLIAGYDRLPGEEPESAVQGSDRAADGPALVSPPNSLEASRSADTMPPEATARIMTEK
jgi:hypothetical protein